MISLHLCAEVSKVIKRIETERIVVVMGCGRRKRELFSGCMSFSNARWKGSVV